MQITPLTVPDALVVTPRSFADDRGLFLEWHRADTLRDIAGRRLPVAQANLSASRRGVLRGLHYADVPPGQAKLVTCPAGAVLDVVVDLRVGSPTFGAWDSVLLDDVHRRAVFVPEGLGHGFLALSEQATVVYLCSAPYAPAREHEVDALDPELGIDWGSGSTLGTAPERSPKDSTAPSLAEALSFGLLPQYTDCQVLYRSLS